MSLKERAKKLKSDIPALALALKDADTPIPAKILAGITMAFALSPVDLIPDFIPMLGYLDDVILLPLFATLTIKLIPPAVLDKCRAQAEGIWENGKPKSWRYAIPIILIWILLIAIVVKAFL